MVDNVAITPGSGAIVAADEVPGGSGVFYQRVKQAFGADGSAVDVSGANPLPVGQTCSTPATTSVASSATNVTLLAANTGRRQAIIWNESSATLYVKLGATASATSYTYQVVGGGYLELPLPVYTGQIDGLWAAVDGNARITELT